MDSASAIDKLNPVSGQTVLEDTVSSLIQGFGLVCALGGVPLLIVLASLNAGAMVIVGVSVYGASLVILYASSCLYHGVQKKTLKEGLKLMDHSAIYLLIAGTYTPLTLGPLNGPWGWSLLGVVWGLAVVGILGKMTGILDSNRRSIPLYLLLGWVSLVAVPPMVKVMPMGGLMLVLTGGISYTLGVVFFVMDRMPFNTAIWHLFVMGGAVTHYFAILFYVAI
ncbi:MAG: hemolysin III family protein [bacterium]